MKLLISALIFASFTTATAQQHKATKPATPAPQQCAVSMPTPDGKTQTVTVDCSVYVLINYLQQQVTALQATKQDKVDHDAATKAFDHKKGNGEI